MTACGYGQVSVVAELLKDKANVSLKDANGDTPILIAYGKHYNYKNDTDYDAVIKMLIKYGADQNSIKNIAD
jgi:ankyrin repeat protein